MRKLDARWDVDVAPPDVEEGDRKLFDRVHFGIRLGHGRHEAEDTVDEHRDPASGELSYAGSDSA